MCFFLSKKLSVRPQGRTERKSTIVGLQILLHAVGSAVGIGADADGELNVAIEAELIQPVQEVFRIAGAAVANDLAEVININVGDIIVACIKAADETTEAFISRNAVFLNVDQTGAMVYVISQNVACFDANYAACFGNGGFVDKIDKLLGLTGTLCAHDKSNHSDHSPVREKKLKIETKIFL